MMCRINQYIDHESLEVIAYKHAELGLLPPIGTQATTGGVSCGAKLVESVWFDFDDLSVEINIDDRTEYSQERLLEHAQNLLKSGWALDVHVSSDDGRELAGHIEKMQEKQHLMKKSS